MTANEEYKAALRALEEYCVERELNAEVDALRYPFRVILTPNPTPTLFDPNPLGKSVNSQGEIGRIVVVTGTTTRVLSDLVFTIEAAVLKKIIKLAETAGMLYLHAFREEYDTLAADGATEEK